MPINIKFLEVYNIIELTYSGKVTNEELEHSVHEAANLSIEKGSRLFLADCTLMTEGHTVFDLYFIVPLFKKYELPSNLVEAIIYPTSPSMYQLASFFETLLINNGINGKAFKERKDAITWLLESKKAE